MEHQHFVFMSATIIDRYLMTKFYSFYNLCEFLKPSSIFIYKYMNVIIRKLKQGKPNALISKCCKQLDFSCS